jgi:hypothetical protein
MTQEINEIASMILTGFEQKEISNWKDYQFKINGFDMQISTRKDLGFKIRYDRYEIQFDRDKKIKEVTCDWKSIGDISDDNGIQSIYKITKPILQSIQINFDKQNITEFKAEEEMEYEIKSLFQVLNIDANNFNNSLNECIEYEGFRIFLTWSKSGHYERYWRNDIVIMRISDSKIVYSNREKNKVGKITTMYPIVKPALLKIAENMKRNQLN